MFVHNNNNIHNIHQTRFLQFDTINCYNIYIKTLSSTLGGAFCYSFSVSSLAEKMAAVLKPFLVHFDAGTMIETINNIPKCSALPWEVHFAIRLASARSQTKWLPFLVHFNAGTRIETINCYK